MGRYARVLIKIWTSLNLQYGEISYTNTRGQHKTEPSYRVTLATTKRRAIIAMDRV